MSILILEPLNFSADVMKWVSTDVSWKWQHVSLLRGCCSPLVYRCVAWCTHRMAHCHLIKYHSCFDREALIESLVSFIKLCVIAVWNFLPFFFPQSLLLLWNMLALESSATKREERQDWEREKKKSKRTTLGLKEKWRTRREREGAIAELHRKTLHRVSCHWIHNSGSWF